MATSSNSTPAELHPDHDTAARPGSGGKAKSAVSTGKGGAGTSKGNPSSTGAGLGRVRRGGRGRR